MCLEIKNRQSKLNYAIRWKFLRISNGLFSPAMGTYYFEGIENHAYLSANEQSGFHVYTEKEHAIGAAKSWAKRYIRSNFVVVKLKMSGFIASGVIKQCDRYSNNKPGEIWKSAKILHVYKDPRKK